MYTEDLEPPSYMAKPNNQVPGSLIHIGEAQVTLFIHSSIHSSTN